MEEEDAERLVGKTASLMVRNTFSGGYIVRVGEVTAVRGGMLSLTVDKDHVVNFPVTDIASADIKVSGGEP